MKFVNPKILGFVAGFLSFIFCLAAGLCILKSLGFSYSKEDAVWFGMGLYFIGKSFFVGPLLMITCLRDEK